MKRILTVALNYFPGYMSGGVARTILNTTAWLGHEFKFLIVTRDRDLGSGTPYPNVELGTWNAMGPADVCYLAPSELSMAALADFINGTDYDLLHLNSYFDPVFTIRIMVLIRLGKIKPPAVLVSPRGEFGAGSLRLKYPRKRAYIELSGLAGLYDRVVWHASSPYEAAEIASVLRIPVQSIKLALDLPVRQARREAPEARVAQPGDTLRLVFLSRMTREKNLVGALRILHQVRLRVSFDMIGPREDSRYWAECEALIKTLPTNVEATYRGTIAPDQVFDSLSSYDLLLFPSLGENYGHVIAESISVGTRVLISQLTPWRNLEIDGLGWDLDLDDTAAFVDVIESLAKEPPAERAASRQRAWTSAVVRLSDPAALEQNRSLFATT